MIVDIKHEIWLAKLIYKSEICTLFVGITDTVIRRDRMRQIIRDRNLRDVIVKKNVTYAQAFERLYGCKL